MNYAVIAHYGDTIFTCDTNDIHVVFTFLLEHSDTKVEVIDTLTGEILCAQNCEKPILEEAFGLALLGLYMG